MLMLQEYKIFQEFHGKITRKAKRFRGCNPIIWCSGMIKWG
jgi:hypothetical protein